MSQPIRVINPIKIIANLLPCAVPKKPRTVVRGLVFEISFSLINHYSMASLLRKKLNHFSAKVYWQEILAVLMLLLAIIFFRSERKELYDIIPHIRKASPFWLLVGFILTACYFILQGGIYRKSFAAIGLSLSWVNSVV